MTLTFERLLFSVTGVNAIAILSWAAILTFGMDSAPYAVLIVLHVVYSILFVPRFTAFRVRRDRVPEHKYYISSVPEGACVTLLYLFLPAAVHASLYRATLMSTLHLSNLGLLLCAPLLGLRWMWWREPLWFLKLAAPGLYDAFHRALLWIPAVLLPLALCFRVIFPSYLDDLSLPQPLGPLLMVAAVYSVVGAWAAHHMGWVSARLAPLVHVAAGEQMLCVWGVFVCVSLCASVGNSAKQARLGR